MPNMEFIERIKFILNQIVPESEIEFKEMYLRIFSGINSDIETNIGLVKFTNNIIENETPLIEKTNPQFNIEEKYLRWQTQINFLLVDDAIKLLLTDSEKSDDLKKSKIKDTINSLKDWQESTPLMKEIIQERIDLIERKNSEFELDKRSINSNIAYYFNLTKEEVEKLYDVLLKNKLIQENKFFLNSFETNNTNKKYISSWIHKQTSAFYLLYLLNKKDFEFDNINLGRIYLKLFNRNGDKTESLHISTNFGKFRTSMSNKKKSQKYSSLIETIYNSLFA
jgi:hypothetical protein